MFLGHYASTLDVVRSPLTWRRSVASVGAGLILTALLACQGGGGSSTPSTPAPTLTTQPVDATVVVGNAATFSVVATGSPTYQWAKGGTAISGATSASYSTPSTTAADDHTVFAVEATNGGGKATSANATLHVNYVNLSTQPVNATVVAGGTATFTVAVTASGTLSYQWQKGGVAVVGATGATYSLANVVVSHAGAYTCVVTSALNGTTATATSTAANLSVSLPDAPVISMQPASATVVLGSEVSFSVTATGAASYQWYNGTQAIAGATSATYSLPTTTPTHDGAVFSVGVTNPGGTTTSANATLRLNLPAAFTTQPATSLTVAQGGSGSLTVAATGNGTLSYQWMKGGVNVSGATSATLALSGFQSADAGTYACLVTNTLNSTTTATVSNNAAVALNAAPRITSQPISSTVAKGGSLSLTLTATGSGTLSYQWMKDGALLSGATSATLALSNVQAASAGTYACVVSNALNGTTSTTTSASATLTVNLPPTITTQPTAAQTVAQGGTVSFTVAATGSGSLSYQWMKGGSVITGATSTTLSFSSLLASDAATYACVVTNTLNGTTTTTTSTNAALVVNAPPTFTTQPASQTLAEGGTATFTVVASGSGSLAYQWKKGGTVLSGATTASLHIGNLQPSDAAAYSCVVTNSLNGTTTSASSANAVLTVVDLSITAPSSQTANEGTTATFSVAASTSNGSAPTYQWQQNGSNIGGATSATLTLPAITPAGSTGSYTCVASTILNGVTATVSTPAVTLSVVPLPVTPVVSINDAIVTVGKVGYTAITQDQGPYAHYNWTIANGENTWTGTGRTLGYKASKPGTVTISVVVSNSYGLLPALASAPGSATTSAVAAPTLLLPNRVHPGDTWMKASVTEAGLSYAWSLVNGGAGTITSGTNPMTASFMADPAATNWSSFQVQVDEGGSAPDPNTATATVNVETGTWLVKDGGATAMLGSQPAAAVLANGRVLLCGGGASDASGFFTTQNTAMIYDPATGRTVPTAPMNVARTQHTATTLNDGTVLVVGGLSQSGLDPAIYLDSAELYDPATGQWTLTFSDPANPWGSQSLMSVPHTYHTATKLSDGRVAVIGGLSTGAIPTGVIELYDPATGTWTANASPLTTNRWAHTATLLATGSVFIAGGTDAASTIGIGQCEILDAGAGTVVPTTASTIKPRNVHTATLLSNGTVLLAGGNGSTAANTAEIFDPKTGPASATFTAVTAKLKGSHLQANTAGRYHHSAHLLAGDKVLLAGGTNDLTSTTGAGVSFSAEIFTANLTTPANGTFTSTTAATLNGATNGPLQGGHFLHAAATLASGQVLLAGGSTASTPAATSQVELYTPANSGAALPNGGWSTPGGIPGGRKAHTATLLADGRILVAGGTSSRQGTVTGTDYSFELRTFMFDPATSAWTATGNNGFARKDRAAVLTTNTSGSGSTAHNGWVLLAGGSSNTGAASGRAERFNPTSGTWASTGSMVASRMAPVMVALQNGNVLVIGNGTTSGNCELYTSSAGTFAATGALSEAKKDFRAVLLANGKVLVTGGVLASGAASHKVELYDPAAGTWSQLTPLRDGRFNHSMTVLQDGRILLAAGQTSDPNNANAALFTGWDATLPAAVAGNGTEIYDLTLPVTVNAGDSSAAQGTGNGFLSEARHGHSALLLSNGKVLLLGGTGSLHGQSATTEVWDPVTDAFQYGANSLAMGRTGHTATPMQNGDLLVVGGALADAVTEIYRPNP